MNKKFSHFKRSGIIISIMRQRTKDILQRSCSIRPKIGIYLPSIKDDDVMVTSLNLKIDTKNRSLIKP